MKLKCSFVCTLLLLLLLLGPGFSAGRMHAKSIGSEVYEIDYRGPETHTYNPPPNRAGPRIPHHASAARHKSKRNQEEEEAEKEVEMKPYSGAVIKHEGKSSTSAVAKTTEAPPHAPPARDARAQRDEWETGIFSCLGKNDEFFSSDLEVCVVGCCAPCVLHGSNVERVGSKAGAATFATHCLPYTALYLLGNCLFGFNCLAPCFSYPNRTAIRRRFNLQGSCDAMAESTGCLGNIKMGDAQHEHCESACDLATHVSCHPCALCQEARELRRKLPHPGFAAKPVIVMLPPGGQRMDR